MDDGSSRGDPRRAPPYRHREGVALRGVLREGGREINPRIVEGQIVGGVAQGIGGALFEAWRYSATGEPTSTTFAAYHLPLTTDVPNVVVNHLHVDTPANPIGVRGAGESGTIAVYSAIASAVDDAVEMASTWRRRRSTAATCAGR